MTDQPAPTAAQIPSGIPVFWKGVDERGHPRGGHAFIESPAKWVEERHERGWRSLTLVSRGIKVGAIEPHADNSPLRRWWGQP